jgi:hypothetical protein
LERSFSSIGTVSFAENTSFACKNKRIEKEPAKHALVRGVLNECLRHNPY